MIGYANIKPIMFEVSCPECGKILIAPDTQMGRLAWVPMELVEGSVHICSEGHYVVIGTPPTSLSHSSSPRPRDLL